MTSSERFTKAHKTAKQIRDCFSTYRDAFAFALKEIYAMEKTQKATDEEIITAAVSAIRAAVEAYDAGIWEGNRVKAAYRAVLSDAAGALDALDARRREIRALPKAERRKIDGTFLELEASAVASAFPCEPPAVAYGHEACVRSQIAAYIYR